MAEVRLHLDADASIRRLQKALLARDHDVSRTPMPWMPLDASDEDQLLGAAAQGRAIFTFNIADFVALAAKHPAHRGIILANQTNWTLSALIAALDHLLGESTAESWVGQVRWLTEWRR